MIDEYVLNTTSYLKRIGTYKLCEGSRAFVFHHQVIDKVQREQLLVVTNKNKYEKYTFSQEKRNYELMENNIMFGHSSRIDILLLSSNDNLLTSCSRDSICCWEAKSCNMIKKMNLTEVRCAAFLPKDRYLALGTRKGEIILVDVCTGDIQSRT